MIQDGALTDSSKWSFIRDGRAPRTALGVKEDGTLLLYTADGRSTSHSMGLSQMDLAEDLKALGTMANAKAQGKVRSEGKEYIMKDGDIVNFLFNV